ncbi:MAG: sigma 54-interacting transcriptional regulator [Polyangiaceae bacterium]
MELAAFFRDVVPLLAGAATLEETAARVGSALGAIETRTLGHYRDACRRARSAELEVRFGLTADALRGDDASGWEARTEAFVSSAAMRGWRPAGWDEAFVAFLAGEAAAGRVPQWVAELADLEACHHRVRDAADAPGAGNEGPLRVAAALEVRCLAHDLSAWLEADPDLRHAPPPALTRTREVVWRDVEGRVRRRALTAAEARALATATGDGRDLTEALQLATLPASPAAAVASARLTLLEHGILLGERSARAEATDAVVRRRASAPAPTPVRDLQERSPREVTQQERCAALIDASRLLLVHGVGESARRALLEQVVAFAAADHGSLFAMRGGKVQLEVELGRTAGVTDRQVRQLLVERALSTGAPLVVADLRADKRLQDRVGDELSSRSAAVIPAALLGETLAVVYLESLERPAHASTPAASDARPAVAPSRFSSSVMAWLADVGELFALGLGGSAAAARERRPSFEELAAGNDLAGIVTDDARMKDLLQTALRVADSDATVLIGGETGTGKELLAQVLHGNSPRKQKPLVVLHCTALPAAVLESELFGHVRGAFTGADRDRPGRIATAHGGTLLLDEVAEIPSELQAKLLRFLQFGEIQRLGSDRTERIDVRVLTATHQDLPALVKAGKFREDLYYRLKVIELRVPPLRERPGDVQLLLKSFLEKHRQASGRTLRWTARALAILENHHWPGNVRELTHVVERACVLATGEELDVDLLPSDIVGARKSAPPAPTSLPEGTTSTDLEALREQAVLGAERSFLVRLLERSAGNISHAARESGIHRSYLQRLMTAARAAARLTPAPQPERSPCLVSKRCR